MSEKSSFFHTIAKKAAQIIGSAPSFILALSFIIVWLITGPIFKFSDTWQLVINTSTSVITFLVVFLIQNTQNRDTQAMNLKLDELIRVHKLAHNSIIDLEKLSDSEIKELEKKYEEQISKKPDCPSRED